jgi:DNA-binding IscR family transcriptional regulator
VAQLVGVTPSYVSQLLGELEREGVVRRERGWIWWKGRCL